METVLQVDSDPLHSTWYKNENWKEKKQETYEGKYERTKRRVMYAHAWCVTDGEGKLGWGEWYDYSPLLTKIQDTSGWHVCRNKGKIWSYEQAIEQNLMSGMLTDFKKLLFILSIDDKISDKIEAQTDESIIEDWVTIEQNVSVPEAMVSDTQDQIYSIDSS